MNRNSPSQELATLYVGDLRGDVTESMLYAKFSTAGVIQSIRVCRDSVTRRSLGYAYVNFFKHEDAKEAFETLNFETINNKPMRIMWMQSDPSSCVGNIFIKNLDKSINNKAVYDTFSAFGKILSCKVETDEEGNSKGYGYVHFETDEIAENVIKKIDGMLLNGKRVYVGKFIPRKEREKQMAENSKEFTNIYVKNFGEELNEEKLVQMFRKYGNIKSAKAVKELDGREINGKELFVGRAKKKSERQAELKRKFEQQRFARINSYHGRNLYVKNLDQSIDDEFLKKLFSPFGTITSVKVEMDKYNSRSRCFGYVCFSSAEEAAEALTKMNGRIILSKPLYATLAQRKEDRQVFLAAEHSQNMASLRMPIFSPSVPQGRSEYFSPQMRGSPRWLSPSHTRSWSQR